MHPERINTSYSNPKFKVEFLRILEPSLSSAGT